MNYLFKIVYFKYIPLLGRDLKEFSLFDVADCSDDDEAWALAHAEFERIREHWKGHCIGSLHDDRPACRLISIENGYVEPPKQLISSNPTKFKEMQD